MLRKKISNFSPDWKKVNIIYKKRILKYLYTMSLFLTLIITSLLVVLYLGKIQTLKIFALIFTIFGSLNLITFAWIFDFGAASKIKKANFKIEGIDNKKQGHTYYYAFLKIGIARIIINSFITIVPIIFVIIIF